MGMSNITGISGTARCAPTKGKKFLMVRMKIRSILLMMLMCGLMIAVGAVVGQEALETPEATPEITNVVHTTYVPIGGFYGDTFPGFLRAALPNVERFETDRLYILVMPMTFSYDAETLTAEDLLLNTRDSERRRRQLEDACREIAPPEIYCEVVVPPIYTREAADTNAVLEFFWDDLAAVYFLGGDQTIAMQITAGTVLEQALAEAYARGVVMGGNSAGLAIGSRVMIGGYGGDKWGPENALEAGAVDLWNGSAENPLRRGLDFTTTDAVLEQHFWERARFARLLNALVDPTTPNVGIGVDSFTGTLIIDNHLLEGTFGLYTGAIMDVESLGAEASATFDSGVLSVRDVLVHVFAPGNFTYNARTRESSLAPTLTSAATDTSALTLPDGVGSLTLYSNLLDTVELEDLNIDESTAVVITGYADTLDADDLADEYDDFTDPIVLTADKSLPDMTGYSTIIVHAEDASLIDVESLRPVQDAWLGGANVILDGAAAAAAGSMYAAMPPVPYHTDNDLLIQDATQGVFLLGSVEIRPGLGLIPVSVEVRVMSENHYGRWFSLAYSTPDQVALGLNDGAFVTITQEGATVGGSNGVFALDLSAATLSQGENGGMVFANGVLDVFAPGEAVE